MADHIHHVRVQYQDGLLTAPVEAWIGLLFQALHPTQQEHIAERFRELAEQAKQPKLYLPDQQVQGVH